MQGPNFGALGATFTVMRGMQAACLIAIIGMTSNFISEIVETNVSPPSELVGTLSVTCIATLYIFLSFILYWDSYLPFLYAVIIDTLLLIALIVISVTVGKPLSYLSCPALPAAGGSVTSFVASVGENLTKINYWVFAGGDRTICYEMKAIWGLSIALCVLFGVSAGVEAALWKRTKGAAPKTIEV